jgi:hypothetical protein
MNAVLLVLLFLLIGVIFRSLSLWQRRNPSATAWTIALPENLADGLTSFVLYVSLPATILTRIPGIEASPDLLVPVALPWGMLVITALLVVLVSRVFRWSRSTTGLMMLLVPLGNTSFLGIPMVEAFFGKEHVRYAVLYDQAGTFLALATYGSMVAARYCNSQGPERSVLVNHVGASMLFRRIVTFPPFLALILAVATTGLDYARPVVSMVEMLGATLVPLVMIAVGFKLEFHLRKDHRTALAAGLFLKLVVTPLVALAACRILALDGPEVDVAIFEAGMPPQVAAWAVAMKAGLEPELGAAMVGFGILYSFVTLTALHQFL